VVVGVLASYAAAAHAQTVINCPSGFNSSATTACGIGAGWALNPNLPGVFNLSGARGGTNPPTPGLSGTDVNLIPAGGVHFAYGFNNSAPVNVQAFTATFTFIPNGYNVAFVLNNNTLSDTSNGGQFKNAFSSGAGAEGGFYQACCNQWPNNVVALQFDQFLPLSANGSFSNSSVQLFGTTDMPINPGSGDGTWQHGEQINRISTSPVALNSPASTALTTTGDTYSVTVRYTGSAYTVSLYDVTAGGSCPGANCFTHTWKNINIPSLVAGNTAFVGINASTNASVPKDLYVRSLVYTVLPLAAPPTFSAPSGSYGSTQSITLSTASSGATICYNTTGNPYTDGGSGCLNGTRYTGPISVSSGQTVYAVAGGTNYGDSTVSNAAYRIGATAAQPTFFPATNDYKGAQWVQLNAAQGSVICYNTTGSPATNGASGCAAGSALYTGPVTVSSSETLYAISGGGAFSSDSAVGQATYTINPYGGTAPTNSPTFSPAPGTYAGTQTVTISTTTSSGQPTLICYALSPSDTPLAVMPMPNGYSTVDTTTASQCGASSTTRCTPGCYHGTLYTGPISVSSSQTLYAVAQATNANTMNMGGGNTPQSSPTVGTYVIGGAQAPAPPTDLTATVL
jgi:hypothetical protein